MPSVRCIRRTRHEVWLWVIGAWDAVTHKGVFVSDNGAVNAETSADYYYYLGISDLAVKAGAGRRPVSTQRRGQDVSELFTITHMFLLCYSTNKVVFERQCKLVKCRAPFQR